MSLRIVFGPRTSQLEIIIIMKFFETARGLWSLICKCQLKSKIPIWPLPFFFSFFCLTFRETARRTVFINENKTTHGHDCI